MRNRHFTFMCRHVITFIAVGLFTCCWSSGAYYPSVKVSEANQAEEVVIENMETSSFHSVTLEPAKVAEGNQVVVKAVFSVSQSGFLETLPVQYSYEIHKKGSVSFRSPTKKIDVGNGAKSVLELKVEAFGGNGDYSLVLKLIHPEGTDRAYMKFSIVSPEEAHAYAYEAGLLKGGPAPRRSREDRLVGKWQFVPQNTGAPGPELTLKKENDELVARVFRKNSRIHWVKLRRNPKTLVLRSKSEDLTGDCWFVVEDIITFNAKMDNMSVRTRVLEGSRCVSIGEVSESTLSRIQ